MSTYGSVIKLAGIKQWMVVRETGKEVFFTGGLSHYDVFRQYLDDYDLDETEYTESPELMFDYIVRMGFYNNEVYAQSKGKEDKHIVLAFLERHPELWGKKFTWEDWTGLNPYYEGTVNDFIEGA